MEKITKEINELVVDYYLVGHSLNETTKYFKLKTRDAVKAILKKNNIALRSKSESYKLRSDLAKQNTRLNKMSRVDFAALSVFVCDLYTDNKALGDIWTQVKLEFGINLTNDEIKDILKNNNIALRTKEERYKISTEKMQATNLEKYGNICSLQNDVVKSKAIKTLQSNYGSGVTNSFCAEEIKEKIKATNFERYGNENAAQSSVIKEKTKQTLLAKYGTDHIITPKYEYDNITFDSLPELCFYLFCTNNSLNISRDTVGIPYCYKNQTHYYFPDFLVGGELVEIKGDQFLKEDGSWQNPFDHEKDELFEAKHQCALANGVKILYGKDYQKYLDWFQENGYIRENFLVKKGE